MPLQLNTAHINYGISNMAIDESKHEESTAPLQSSNITSKNQQTSSLNLSNEEDDSVTPDISSKRPSALVMSQ